MSLLIHFAKKHSAIVGIIVLGVLVAFGMMTRKTEETEIDKENELPEQESLVELAERPDNDVETAILADVKGEVKRPGVYEANHGVRVVDIIEKAGGFTENADENQINLAQIVHDEMVIIIPKIGEESSVPVSAEQSGSDKIKINQASKEEIEQLNGIGPAKAQAIVDHREENGPFQQVDDLLEVNGIGEKTLENVKEDIVVP